jgi:acetyl-CoA acetyltransferase
MTASADIFVLGIASTTVGRFPDRTFVDLCRQVVTEAGQDAGLPRLPVERAWFSSVLMDFWGQRACRGQEVLTPLCDEDLLPHGLCIQNVEAGCASGMMAFLGAVSDVLSGEADIALAVGIEKMNHPERPRGDILEWIEGTAGRLEEDYFYAPHRKLAAQLSVGFSPGEKGRSIAMDVYALWAQAHKEKYGTTDEHIAAVAAKNHTNAVDNPRAQYRFPMTTEDVLADRMVTEPLTRAMCAPTGDGAAAVLVCSRAHLDTQPRAVRERALPILGHAFAGGSRWSLFEDDRAAARAARRAYQRAGIEPSEVDLVELHDATAIGEILLLEDLGLCARGQGGPFTASGATARDGETPVNVSGGLVSRGHPIGATGIMMLNEVALQLRGEAGALQLPRAQVGLAENGGGIVGHDNAVSAVTILGAPARSDGGR